MNKYKRAKEWIDSLDDDWSRVDIEWEAIDEIRKLVDKATPKKPSIAHSINGEAESYCRSCQRRFSTPVSWARISYKHCPECGQKLDWSKI